MAKPGNTRYGLGTSTAVSGITGRRIVLPHGQPAGLGARRLILPSIIPHRMKFLFVLLCGSVLLTTALATRPWDIFSTLQIDREEVPRYVDRNFEDGELRFPNTRELKKLDPSRRAAAVKEIGDFIKSYMQSPVYAKKFSQDRENAKPKSAEGKIKAEIADLEKSIPEAEKDLKEATEATKALAESLVKLLKEKYNALKNPADPKHDLYVMTVAGMDYTNAADYEAAVKKWDAEYPATPKDLIRKRLQQFLDLTADINFDAELKTDSHGVKYFADEELERKNEHWKLCFRSGKETVTAARAYADQWLKELK